MTSTTPWCLKCGWGDEKRALAPLYADRIPGAQPIAWAHQDCFKPEEEAARPRRRRCAVVDGG
jgi:hypothetical protein